jgi:tryprostatin B 6-hydroxylase
MELRIVTAMLLREFDISFAPGDDGTELLEDTRDAFASAPGKLELVFRARQ